VASAILMTSLGIWSCQWRELRPMTFGAKTEAKGEGQENKSVGSLEDEGGGHGRGRGRGRGRDGGGEYEMLGMSEGAETNV